MIDDTVLLLREEHNSTDGHGEEEQVQFRQNLWWYFLSCRYGQCVVICMVVGGLGIDHDNMEKNHSLAQ